MLSDDAVWRAWGGLLGCRCADCEENARRFVCLYLDQDLRIASSGSVSEVGTRFTGVAERGTPLPHIVDQSAFEAMRAQLNDALMGQGWSGAFIYRGHDAAEIIVKIAVLPLFGAEGAPAGVQLTLEDKTRSFAQKATQTALRDRLSIIQQYAADGILSIDERGVIESANRAAELMFGWRASELIGRPISLLMPPSFADKHQAYVERYLKTGQSGILNVGPRTLAARRKNGDTIQIDLSVAEASVGSRTVFIGVCRDVTRRNLSTESASAQSSATYADPILELADFGGDDERTDEVRCIRRD